MVQFVRQHLRPDLHLGLGDRAAGEDLLNQGSFQFPCRAFDPAVVRRIMGWRVQRDDQMMGQDLNPARLMPKIGMQYARYMCRWRYERDLLPGSKMGRDTATLALSLRELAF
jgi:hypothetical protein